MKRRGYNRQCRNTKDYKQLLWTTTWQYGEGNGTPLQYSCLENPMDWGAWRAAVHGVAKSWTRLSDFPFTFHFDALEKEMATHSSILAWRIPGMGEPGGLPSMGSHRVGHDWSNLAAAAAAAESHWRRQRQLTPVLLPGKSHGWRSLVTAVHGVARSQTRLSDFTFTFHFHASETAMATHSSVSAWRMPGTGEPGGLLSLGSHRVRHDWSDLAAAAAESQLWVFSKVSTKEYKNYSK